MNSINEAMIFAAGFGKRMLPLTIKTPKPLLKINNKSIISYQIERLLELNFKQILVNGHYLFNELNKQLKIYSPYVKVIYEEEILETGGGLLNLLKKKKFMNLESPKLLINGDIFWQKKKNCPVEMLIKKWDDSMDFLLVLKDKNNVLGYNGNGDFSLKDENKRVSRIFKKTKNNFVFTGLQIINPKVIKNKKKNFLLEKFFLNQL